MATSESVDEYDVETQLVQLLQEENRHRSEFLLKMLSLLRNSSMDLASVEQLLDGHIKGDEITMDLLEQIKLELRHRKNSPVPDKNSPGKDKINLLTDSPVTFYLRTNEAANAYSSNETTPVCPCKDATPVCPCKHATPVCSCNYAPPVYFLSEGNGENFEQTLRQLLESELKRRYDFYQCLVRFESAITPKEESVENLISRIMKKDDTIAKLLDNFKEMIVGRRRKDVDTSPRDSGYMSTEDFRRHGLRFSGGVGLSELLDQCSLSEVTTTVSENSARKPTEHTCQEWESNRNEGENSRP